MRLRFDPSSGDDDDAADEARQNLVQGFDRWLETQPPIGAEAFDADLLLNWKYSYGDGDFGSWRRSDVDEVLLEHLPRKLSASASEAASIPVTLGAFVHYLDESGLLTDESDDAGAIADRAMAQRQRFLDALDDPGNWGIAKRFVNYAGLAGDDDEEALTEAMSASTPCRSRSAAESSVRSTAATTTTSSSSRCRCACCRHSTRWKRRRATSRCSATWTRCAVPSGAPGSS